MNLHFSRRGQGPALVLVHGLFGSLENLGGIARGLAENFTTYTLDLPGHGRSPHIDNLSLATLVKSLLDWADTENIETFYLLGHSLGGKVAMDLALTHPNRVSKLVIMDISPASYDPHHSDVFDGLMAVDLTQLTSRSDADLVLQPYVPEAAVRSFLLKNLVKSPTGFSWRMDLRNLHEAYPGLIGENISDKVFSGKTLFLKGGTSSYIEERHRSAILRRFPDVSLKVVANTGHWLHAEKPELVTRLINNFLSQE